jgi:hypothetical protein
MQTTIYFLQYLKLCTYSQPNSLSSIVPTKLLVFFVILLLSVILFEIGFVYTCFIFVHTLDVFEVRHYLPFCECPHFLAPTCGIRPRWLVSYLLQISNVQQVLRTKWYKIYRKDLSKKN